MAGDFHHIFTGIGTGRNEHGSQHLIQYTAFVIVYGAEMHSVRGLLLQVFSVKYAVGNPDSVWSAEANNTDGAYA